MRASTKDLDEPSYKLGYWLKALIASTSESAVLSTSPSVIIVIICPAGGACVVQLGRTVDVSLFSSSSIHRVLGHYKGRSGSLMFELRRFARLEGSQGLGIWKPSSHVRFASISLLPRTTAAYMVLNCWPPLHPGFHIPLTASDGGCEGMALKPSAACTRKLQKHLVVFQNSKGDPSIDPKIVVIMYSPYYGGPHKGTTRLGNSHFSRVGHGRSNAATHL